MVIEVVSGDAGEEVEEEAAVVVVVAPGGLVGVKATGVVQCQIATIWILVGALNATAARNHVLMVVVAMEDHQWIVVVQEDQWEAVDQWTDVEVVWEAHQWIDVVVMMVTDKVICLFIYLFQI